MTDNVRTSSKIERAEAKRERRKEKRRLTLAVLLIFLTIYVALSLLVIVFYYFSFRSGSKSQTLYSVDTARFVLKSNGSYKKVLLSSADAEKANMDYGLYVGFDELNELCGFSIAGNGDKLTMIIRGTDEYAELFANSSFLYVNENPVRLSSPVLYKGGKYYIPMEFVDEYVIGIDVVYDDDEEICTVSVSEKKNFAVGFKLQKQESIPSVNIKLETSEDVSEDVSVPDEEQ